MFGFNRQFFWLIVSAVLLLSGCASKSAIEPDSSQTDEPAKVETVVSEAGSEPEENLPEVELSKDLLKQILVSGFASYAGDWQQATESAYQAAQASQDYRYARYASVLALRSNNFELAEQSALLWEALQPQDVEAQTTLLLAVLSLGQIEKAYRLLNEYQQQQAKPIDDYIKDVATLLVQQKNADSGVGIAERYVADNPESAQVLLSSAYVLEHFGKNGIAEQWLIKAMQLKPGWDLVAQLKSRILRKQGKLERRAEYIEDYVKQYPESVNMRINYAAVLSEKDQFESALEVMKGVVKDDPKNISALIYTAAIAAHLKQDDLAKKMYRNVVAYEIDNDEARWQLARYAILDKKYDLAEKHYSKITSERSFFGAQIQIASMRYEQSGLDSAMRVLDNLQPQSQQDFVDLANARQMLLMQEFQYEEALAAINETLTYLPNDMDLRYSRALAAAELGEIELVESDLRFILDRTPNNANALNALGYTLADQTKRFDEAKVLIEKALKLLPDAAHVLDSMGWVLYRLKDYKQALVYLRKAYEKMPEAEVAAHLGEVLWESGDADGAKKLWQSAIDNGKSHPVLTKTMQRYSD